MIVDQPDVETDFPHNMGPTQGSFAGNTSFQGAAAAVLAATRGKSRPPATPIRQVSDPIPFPGRSGTLRNRAAIEAALAEAKRRLANAKTNANRTRLRATVANLQNTVRELNKRPEKQARTRAATAAANVATTEEAEAAALRRARASANEERRRIALEQEKANAEAKVKEALGLNATLLSKKERNALRQAVNKMRNLGLKKVANTLVNETPFNLVTARAVIARYRALHRGRPNVADDKFIKNLRLKMRAAAAEEQRQLLNNIKKIYNESGNEKTFNAAQQNKARNLLAQYNRAHRGVPGFMNNRNVSLLRERMKYYQAKSRASPPAPARQAAPPRRPTPNIGAAVANAVTQAIKAATTPATAKKFVQNTPPPVQRAAAAAAMPNVPPAVAQAMNPNDLAKAIVAAIEAGVKKIPPKVAAPALAPPAAPANSKAVARALDPKVLAEAVVEAIRQGIKVSPEVIRQQPPEVIVPELQKAAPNTGKLAENVAQTIGNAVRSAARPGPQPGANKRSWRNFLPSFGRQAEAPIGSSLWNRIKAMRMPWQTRVTSARPFTNENYARMYRVPPPALGTPGLTQPNAPFRPQGPGAPGGPAVVLGPNGQPIGLAVPAAAAAGATPTAPGAGPAVTRVGRGAQNNAQAGVARYIPNSTAPPKLTVIAGGTVTAVVNSMEAALDITYMRTQVNKNNRSFAKIFIEKRNFEEWEAAKAAWEAAAAATQARRRANQANQNARTNPTPELKTKAEKANNSANKVEQAAKKAREAAQKAANAAATATGGTATAGGAKVTGPTITFSPTITVGLNKLPQAVQQARNDPAKMANLMKLVNNLKTKLPAESKTQEAIQQLFKEPNKLPTPTQVKTALTRSYKNMNLNELLAYRATGKNRAVINAHLRESVRTQLRRIGRLSGTERSTYMAELYRSLPKNFAGRAEVERELVREVRSLGLRTSGGGYGGYGGYGGRPSYESRGILEGLRRNLGGSIPPRLRQELQIQERRIASRQGPLRQYGRQRQYGGRMLGEGALLQRGLQPNNRRGLAAQAPLRQTGFPKGGRPLLSQGLLKQGGPQLNIGMEKPLAPLPPNQQSAITKVGGPQAALQTVAAVPGGAPQVALAAQALNETNGNRQKALERGVKPEAINAVQKLGGATTAGYVLEGLNTLAQTRKTQVRKAKAPARKRKATGFHPRLNELNNVINAVKKRKLISLVAHNVTHTGIHNNENRSKKYYKKVIKSSILRRPLANKVRAAAKKTSNAKAKARAKKR